MKQEEHEWMDRLSRGVMDCGEYSRLQRSRQLQRSRAYNNQQ